MAWESSQWREERKNQVRFVLGTTAGKAAALGPSHMVATKVHMGLSQPTYKSRTFTSNNKGEIDAANSLPDLMTNGKDRSQKGYKECDTDYRLPQMSQGILSNLFNTSQLYDESHGVEHGEGIVTLKAYMIIKTKI